LSLGFETYGSLGELKDIQTMQEQDHRLGPAIYHEIELGLIKLEYQFVWLFGLTEESPDNTFRWQLEFEF